MEIRVLGAADRAAAERFLKQQPAGMAIRGFLARDGITPKYGHYAAAFEGGEIVSIAAYLGQAFHLVAPVGLEGLLDVLGRLQQGSLMQINGPTEQVDQALRFLGAANARTIVNSRDELFVLKLADLQVPPQLAGGALKARLATREDIAFQGAWRHDFWVENLGAPRGPLLLESCTKLVETEVGERTLYVLEDG